MYICTTCKVIGINHVTRNTVYISETTFDVYLHISLNIWLPHCTYRLHCPYTVLAYTADFGANAPKHDLLLHIILGYMCLETNMQPNFIYMPFIKIIWHAYMGMYCIHEPTTKWENQLSSDSPLLFSVDADNYAIVPTTSVSNDNNIKIIVILQNGISGYIWQPLLFQLMQANTFWSWHQ